ncbi:MAG: hypothetical protein ABSA66_14885 [Roseiarcus sp.]|jgi:hypothetical protein
MADKIEEIVNRAIEHTLTILDASRGGWSVAQAGLEKIHDDLAFRTPGHPALDRLKAFIADRDQVRSER